MSAETETVSEGQSMGLPPLPEPDVSIPDDAGDYQDVWARPLVELIQRSAYESGRRDAYEAGKLDAVAALTADPDVVERVARALVQFERIPDPVPTWEEHTTNYREHMRERARVLLAALTHTPKEQQA